MRLVRLLLVWLVAIAIPMQGLAASTMLFCAPQTPGAQVTSANHDHAAHARMGGDATAMHGDMHAGDDEGGAAGDDPACSVCAACCTGVAITASQQQPAVLDMSTRYAPVVTDPHAGFMTSGVERPPRNMLA